MLLAFVLTGCAKRDADQLKSELQTVSSWTATARMTGEAWLKQALPRAYTAQTFRIAGETMQEEMKTIRERPGGGAAEPWASLFNQAGMVGQLTERMREAVEKRDDQALDQLLKQLETQEQAIKALAKSGGVAEP